MLCGKLFFSLLTTKEFEPVEMISFISKPQEVIILEAFPVTITEVWVSSQCCVPREAQQVPVQDPATLTLLLPPQHH